MRARNAYLDWRGNERANSVRQRAARVRLPTAPSMPVKTPKQRAKHMQHCARDLLVRQRTPAIIALRVHVGDLGPTLLRCCSPGAFAVLKQARALTPRNTFGLLVRKPPKVVAVAVANNCTHCMGSAHPKEIYRSLQ
jgi:hypothetical protein